MSKSSKKRARRKQQARKLAKTTPAMRLPLIRVVGRRPADPDIGPTPQTVANQRRDTLRELLRLGAIDVSLVKAGHDVERGFRSRAPNGGGSRGAGPGVDPRTVDVIDLTYMRWCVNDSLGRPYNELRRRCGVDPDQVVDWLNDFARWAKDDKADDGVLIKALEWWKEAAREAARNAESVVRAGVGQ